MLIVLVGYFIKLLLIQQTKWVIEEQDMEGYSQAQVPHFHFHHLIRKIKNLPQEFWPYLQGLKYR